VTKIITAKVEDKCPEIIELLKRKLKSKCLITQEKLEVNIFRRLEIEM
jgi:NADPH-dependent 7-cyano-7-deazaguanine reductase QueF